MSGSESDVAFESADEGEELFCPTLNISHSSNKERSIEKLHSSSKDSNDEIKKYCEMHENERHEYNLSQETNVYDIGIEKNIKNSDNDSNFYKNVSNKNEKELRVAQDSDRKDNQLLSKDTYGILDLTKSKYTEDTYVNEKPIEILEKISNDKVQRLGRGQKNEIPEQSKHVGDSSNNEKQDELGMTEINKTVKERPERVVLKLEKKLSEKSRHKNVAEKVHKKKENEILDTAKEQQTSSWGWGNWSSSLLSTAASSVSAFTSQVSEGFGTVLETVESTLGAPPPEELAAAIELKKKEGNNHDETRIDTESITLQHTQKNLSGLLDGVSSISKVLENTGSKVLMTGLDTLELIGKTTIDILTEGDPGLRKKRAYFKDTTNLSEILREARDKVEVLGNSKASEVEAEETIHYSTFFDNFQGIVHLEALEMLSKQNRIKLQGWLLSQDTEDTSESKKRVIELQEICETLPVMDDTLDEKSHHEFIYLIKNYISKLELDLNTNKLEKAHKKIHEWLKTCQEEQDKGEVKDAKNLHHEALKSMAHLTACSMELFHKVTEMILYKSPDVISAISCANYLTDITGVLCFEVGIIAAKFCHCLNTSADDSEDPDSITPLITNVFLEASNSSTYIQDAFQLLVPVLQVVAIKQYE